MDVILKKAKITAGILNQASLSTTIDFKVGEVLGWCVHKNRTYIILYRNNLITKYPLFREIDVEIQYKDNHTNKSYLVKVRFDGNYTPFTYIFDDENKKDEFVTLMKDIKQKALTRGQFFI